MVLGPVVEIEKIEPKNQNKCKRWKERRNPHNQQTAKKFLTTPVVCTSTAIAGNEKVDFASWVFNLSPPPSSLPVPKFCMRRSKLSCNAETN